MSPRDETPLRMMLSRRALASRLAAGAAAIGIAGRAGAAVPGPDPELRDAALRGLALADLRGDPVGAAAARAAAQEDDKCEASSSDAWRSWPRQGCSACRWRRKPSAAP
ncbi:hypothetical protein [Albidovulum sp.]|uniref:hypothetical protein n=1 Tax=Albidovulum sp. TaxID=1872424 RepID=UPI0039B89283